MIYNPKKILITGASSGLGASLAILYAKPNCTLFLAGRNEERLMHIVNLCQKQGAAVYNKIIDVRDKEAMFQWLTEIDVDLVIANAGISAGPGKGMESFEQTQRIFDTNLQGVLNTILPIIPSFIKNKHGQIVIISSLAGYRGLPNCPAYSASKASIKAYGEALRVVLYSYRVGVTVVTPGYIKTPLTDLNQFPMPFIMSAEKAALIIKDKLQYNPALIAFPWQLHLMVRLLCSIPSSLADYILTKLPSKSAIKHE